MLRLTADSKKNNAGFSLVELIIVVSILAIAAVPLMKSMGMASKTNAKAQSIQNATSLGESVMEKMKATPVDKLSTLSGWSFTDNGTDYVLTRNGMSATQGEKFDVKVKMDKASYSDNTTPVANKADNVKSANSLLLPRIEDIDTLSQAVLSSERELNKYDKEALNYFNQRRANYPTDKATITSKTIDIVKTDVTYPEGVTVKATVKYTDDTEKEDGTPDPQTYIRELYTGSFVPIEKDGSTELKPLDSNIYIFYRRNKDTTVIPATLQETIKITDNSTYDKGLDPTDSHRVYFIRQAGLDGSIDTLGPVLDLGGTEFKYLNVDDLEADGTQMYGKIKLVTNLDPTNIDNEGHIYTEEARTRVYDITVELYKSGESTPVTSLNSTRSASDTPTPTPTPTT